jgi:predicted CXXCH cytochrome family protein
MLFLASPLLFGISTPSFAREAGCITSKCHAGIDKDRYVHGPVVVGECLMCHGKSPGHGSDPEQYSFKMIKDVAKTCYVCHEDSHTPIKNRAKIKNSRCTTCHDPHGSASPSLLIE